jgi:hypothetical protein
MQLELDPHDIHLLKEMAALGEIGHGVPDQNRRLERLQVEGYVSSVRRDPPGLDAPPAWVYRLTIKGRAIASRR